MEMVMEVKDELGPALQRLNAREADLEERLAAAEATIAEMRAESARPKRAVPAGAGSLMAKHTDGVDAGALDSALRSLSIEQRIAVKSEMLRAGLLA